MSTETVQTQRTTFVGEFDPAKCLGGPYVGPQMHGPGGILHDGECEALVIGFARWLGDPKKWTRGQQLLEVDARGVVIHAADIPMNSPIGIFKDPRDPDTSYGSPDGKHDHAALFRGFVKADGTPWNPATDAPAQVAGMKVIEQIPPGYKTFGAHPPEETVMKINGGYLNNAEVFSTIGSGENPAPDGKGVQIVSAAAQGPAPPVIAPPAPVVPSPMPPAPDPPPAPVHPALATPAQTHAEYLARLARDPLPLDISITKGQKNGVVTQLQERLGALGYSVGATKADGDFGAHTEQALRQFQLDHNLALNGKVADPATLEALNTAMKMKAAQAQALAAVAPSAHAEKPSPTTAHTSIITSPFKFASAITSPYGMRPDPSGQGRPDEFHNGVDVGAAEGRGGLGYHEPVFAGGPGRVEAVGQDPLGGDFVRIALDNGYKITYCHIEPIAKPGDRVNSDMAIGVVNGSGESFGPHVFVLVRDPRGNVIDPATVMEDVRHPQTTLDPSMRRAVADAGKPASLHTAAREDTGHGLAGAVAHRSPPGQQVAFSK